MTQYESYAQYAYNIESNVEVVNAIFRKVYQYMALGLILTALTAWFTASSMTMIRFLFSSKYTMLILGGLEIATVIYLSASIHKISASMALGFFVFYSILNGLTCSVLLLVYTGESVYKTFLATAGMFGVTSLIGIYTKRDLTSFGNFLTMGLMGLVIALIVNLFMRSSAVELYTSIFGIIIFLGLTIWDTAKIKLMASSMYDDSDSNVIGKIAVMGALQLYLDFINIFLFLLRFMGKSRD